MAFTPSNIIKQPKYTIEPVLEQSSSVHGGSKLVCSDEDEYYIFDTQLNLRESRNVEFKAAQGRYIVNMLPETLAKYACAFVNGEGGTMYLGIRDNGRVQGIPWDGKYDRDTVKRVIDDTLGKFLPSAPKRDIRIIPVYQLHYVQYNNYPVPRNMPNKKVIRIEVHQGDLAHIWETGTHEVWVKRDGSVEKQNPLEIKDLAISRYKQMLAMRGNKGQKRLQGRGGMEQDGKRLKSNVAHGTYRN